jgi:hypothetical protein
LLSSKKIGLHKKNTFKKVRSALKPFDISISSYLEQAITILTNEQKRVLQLIDAVTSETNKKRLTDLSKNLRVKYEELCSLKTQMPEKYLNKNFLNEAVKVWNGEVNEMPPSQQVFYQLQKQLLYEAAFGGLSWGPELSIFESISSKNAPLTIWSTLGGAHAKRLTSLLIEEGYSLIYDTLTRISDGNNRIILNAQLSEYKNTDFLQHVLPLEHEFDDVLKPTHECKKRYELFLSQAIDLEQLRERHLDGVLEPKKNKAH